MKLNLDNLDVLLNLSECGITTIIEGAAGIGKTEMLKEIISKKGIPNVFTSAYVIADGDTQPIISPNVQTGKTNTDLSNLMKMIINLSKETGKGHGIFFLDELNLLNPIDLKAILHWFNEGSIDLPFNPDEPNQQKFDISNISLISAWNDPDKGFLAAGYVDPSMKSRLAIVHASIDITAFKEYAFENFDTDVCSFIINNKEKINGASGDSDTTISPRMLEKLSDVMYKIKQNGILKNAIKNNNYEPISILVSAIMQNDVLTEIFMKILNDKSRISLQKLFNSKNPCKIAQKISTNEQVRLLLELLRTDDKELFLDKHNEKTIKKFIDNVSQETLMEYSHQLKMLSDNDVTKNDFNLKYITTNSDSELFKQQVEIIKKNRETVQMVHEITK